MSGLKKIKVFQYTKDGKFLKSYKSLSDFKNKNKLTSTLPIFISNKLGNIDYFILKDSIIFKNRIGRDDVKFYWKIIHSYFCKQIHTNKLKQIEVLNYKNEVIATFSSSGVAKKLLSGEFSSKKVPYTKKPNRRRAGELLFLYD